MVRFWPLAKRYDADLVIPVVQEPSVSGIDRCFDARAPRRAAYGWVEWSPDRWIEGFADGRIEGLHCDIVLHNADEVTGG